MGPVIAALMVAGLVAVCGREIYKGHKSGGCGGCSGGCSGCSGSCASCSGCAHHVRQK
ncbi:MAG: FeoB-associated Cys-rich membrane protein [Eubacterium sp.]|nr:FeoB-associated Cys-rich membrane protein [Eubacterium sp.]